MSIPGDVLLSFPLGRSAQMLSQCKTHKWPWGCHSTLDAATGGAGVSREGVKAGGGLVRLCVCVCPCRRVLLIVK